MVHTIALEYEQVLCQKGAHLVPFMTQSVPQDVGLKAVCHRHPGSQQSHTFHLFIPHITKQQQSSGRSRSEGALTLPP